MCSIQTQFLSPLVRSTTTDTTQKYANLDQLYQPKQASSIRLPWTNLAKDKQIRRRYLLELHLSILLRQKLTTRQSANSHPIPLDQVYSEYSKLERIKTIRRSYIWSRCKYHQLFRINNSAIWILGPSVRESHLNRMENTKGSALEVKETASNQDCKQVVVACNWPASR